MGTSMFSLTVEAVVGKKAEGIRDSTLSGFC